MYCDRWMDTGCEDRKLYRALLPMGEMPILQSPAGQIGKTEIDNVYS